MITRPTRLATLLAIPGLLAVAAPARAQGQDETYQGEAPDRYAMVRAVEGSVRIHKGDADEDLGRGTPVGEGDVVESRGRGVLQLGDGTRVAFGGDTRFTVANLFTEKGGEKQILLRLDRGRLRVKMDGDGETRFRIDTASGSVTCLDRGTFDVETDRDGATRVRVQDGRVRFTNERDEARLSAGEQLSAYGPQDRLDRIRDYNTYDVDDFDQWSDRTWMVRRGRSWDYIPPELRYYSDGLDDHGDWVHSDEYGWVWRPTGCAEDWRPYYAGRWGCYPGGMTWISDEPWGYVTYHHGRWSWSVGLGWCWIPGVYYSPAWVAWNSWDGYCGWAPLGYYNTPCTWGYGAWGGGYCWNAVPYNRINVVNINNYYVVNRGLITGLSGGTGATTWTAAGANRGLGAPWLTRPLIADRNEFRQGQIQRAFQPEVNRQRLDTYMRAAQATGRPVLFRRDPAPATGNGGGVNNRLIPFETRGRAGATERPGPQGQRPGNTGVVPPNRQDRVQPQGGRPTGDQRPGREAQPDRPRRDFQDRPQRQMEDRPQRRDEAPRRPAGEDRVPRSFDREDRPRRDFQDRPQRQMEDRPQRREDAPRPSRDFESRPAPQRFEPAPRQEPRPAPAPSRSEPSRSEAPRSEGGHLEGNRGGRR